MRKEEEVYRAIALYADMIRRICFMRLKNYADTEDIFQDVFLKYILHDRGFENEAHEKAWFIRVAINACKDSLKSFFRTKVVSLEEMSSDPIFLDQEKSDLWRLVWNLPRKYRDVIYLFYYEGYSAVEIAEILEKSENTIYTWLSRARMQLRAQIEGENVDREETL